MRRCCTNPRFLTAVAAVVLLLIAAAPAIGRTVQAQLMAMVEHGFSGSITFKLTNEGRTHGQTVTGVVGNGTFSGKLSGGAAVAATVLGVLKGVPAEQITQGGSYVTRFDVDAKGDHHGLVVATFKSSGLGSLCLRFDVAYGKFKAGTDYIPSTGAVTAIGGQGKVASLHGSARFKQGEVTGSATERFLSSGSIVSVSSGAATPLSKDCSAVAALAK